MTLDLLEPKGAGGARGVDIYERLLRYFDSAISKAVLGQDFTTELPQQGGSRAAAQVGKDVRDDLLRWDATRLSDTLTRDLVRPLVDLNLGPRTRYPSLTMKILASVDTKAFVDAVGEAADHGVDIGQNAVREILGVPAPAPGEKLLTPRQVVRVVEEEGMPKDLVMTRSAAHASSGVRRPSAPLEGWAERMARDWQPVLDPMVEPIKRVINGATDFEDAKRRITAAADEMDVTPLQSASERATFVARLAARNKVPLPEE